MEKVIIKALDGYNLNVHVFEVINPKGFVQVIHGMEEHQERYLPLVHALNEAGYTTITSNMRGHGDDAPVLGYFSKKNGYKLILDDQRRITSYIKNRFNINKIIIFGHSMGSIILRNLMQTETKDYQKIIICGYPCPQFGCDLAIVLANILAFFKGGNSKSNLLTILATGKYNKKISNPKTNMDWLSVSEDNVNKYINDPYCGFGFTISGFKDLFNLTKNMTKIKRYQDINNVPILLISGKEDPCTGYEKGKEKSKNILVKAGFSDIEVISYDNMRHEILNEKDYQNVINDIITFLSK